ncbi:hypothetical protein LTR95_011473 [Oleoguttula sp. CCFEE 5521]
MASMYTNSPDTPRLFMTQSPMPDDDRKPPARPAKRARRAPRESSEIHGLPTRGAATQSADTSAVRETTEVVDLGEDDDELVVTSIRTIPPKISALPLIVPEDLKAVRKLYKNSLQAKLDRAEKLMEFELKHCSTLQTKLSSGDQVILNNALFGIKKSYLESMRKARVWFDKLDDDLKEHLAGLPKQSEGTNQTGA